MTYGIYSDRAPVAQGAYSPGASAARYIFISGQIGQDPKTLKLVSDSFSKQLEQAILNMQTLLTEVHLGLDDVVKTTVYLRSLDNLGEVDAVFESLFMAPRPARTCVEVSNLRDGALVEVECIACR